MLELVRMLVCSGAVLLRERTLCRPGSSSMPFFALIVISGKERV